MNIFMGDYTESPATDLERKNIHIKQRRTSEYENVLLSYLEDNQTLIIKSKYNGIICEYDFLIASQYFIYYISNYLNIDMSKPSYSSNALKIYSYKE